MKEPLFAPVPGFDQPLAVLKHCHERIRKQLRTLDKLLPHLKAHGADQQAQQAAAAVIKYFDVAAHHHHADEEQDLMPMLQTTAAGPDSEMLAALVPKIASEHADMEALWERLAVQLKAIASGKAADLSEPDVAEFARMYTGHMEQEENIIAPMAQRLFSAAQMAQLGDAMRTRRALP